MPEKTGGVARSLLTPARSTAGPPAGVRQAPTTVHPIGLGTDVGDNYWQAEQKNVIVPRAVMERLREAHLWQLDQLRQLHPLAVEANQWDLHYHSVLRNLEESRDEFSSVAKEEAIVFAELERQGELRAKLKEDMERLKNELLNIERTTPGLARRLAEDEEWRKALTVGSRNEEKRYLRLKPLRQAFARRSDDPFEVKPKSAVNPQASINPEKPSGIEVAQHGLNVMVRRLKHSLGPLESSTIIVPNTESTSDIPKTMIGQALQNVRENDNLARELQAEAKLLRSELKASSENKQAARDELEQVRETYSLELLEARRDLRNAVDRDKIKPYENSIRDQDRIITSLTMQLGEMHAAWADDLEKLHGKYKSDIQKLEQS